MKAVTGIADLQNMFSDECRFNLSYYDDRLCVRQYRGERSLKIALLRGKADKLLCDGLR